MISRWRHVVCVVLVALVSLNGCSVSGEDAAGGSTADSADLGFGIAGDFFKRSPAEIDRAFRDYAAAGMTWARVQVTWYTVQATEGGPYSWQEYELLFNAMRANGITPIALLTTTPPWERNPNCLSTGGWETACPPMKVDGFAEFAAAAARRFPEEVVWEVWNEPNLRAFWQPSPDVAHYTKLLVATYDAIKAVDPDATVISGGLTLALNTDESVPPVDFLEGIYANGGAGKFDGLGWHPYLSRESGEALPPPGEPDPASAWFQMYGTPTSARSLMIENGDGDKKIWVTEFGNHTSTSSVLSATDEEHAAVMGAAVREWSSYDWAAAFCFYTYRDSQEYGASDISEAYFGLWRVDYSPKPAVATISEAIIETRRR